MRRIARAHHIAEGNPGVLQTLERMRLMVHDDLGSPWIQWALRQVLQGATPSPEARIGAIYQWVMGSMHYIIDGEGTDSVLAAEEEIRSPNYLLDAIYQSGIAEGDCDDFVILLAALLLSAGTRVRWIVTSARDDGEFDHVFLQAWTGTGWLTLDGIHGAPLDWHVPTEGITNLQVIDV